MGFKYQLSPRGMVLYILNIYPNEAMSLKDIKKKILSHFEYNITEKTIIKAIDEGDIVTGNIVETTERRGVLNLPVKCFSIHYNNTEI